MKLPILSLLAFVATLFADGLLQAQSITASDKAGVQQEQQDVKEYVRVEKTTAEFSVVVEQVETFIRKHGVEKVLLVVDLDNTLLAMNQDLGSDQWFNWQESLLEEDKQHPDLVASSFNGLLEVQGVLFALSSMHPPQPDLPELVKELSSIGLSMFILTSRGKEFRSASQRELLSSGYDFAAAAPTIREKRGDFSPYDVRKPKAHGLSAEIVERLGQPRAVTYANGIYMTAGQHKGYMLQTLLSRMDRKEGPTDSFAGFEAIVFVDDREKHTKRVQDSFERCEIDLATFRYSREDGNVSKFMNSTKDHVVRDWNLLNAFSKTVLVK